MAKYCRPFMSTAGTAHAGSVFGVLGYLAETFTFLYIGQSALLDTWLRALPRAWPFILVSFAALALARVGTVYPLTALVNHLTPPGATRVPRAHQHVLVHSGLRGAMAFALAAQARNALKGSAAGEAAGELFLCTAFFVVRAYVLNLFTRSTDRSQACVSRMWLLTAASERYALAAAQHCRQVVACLLARVLHRQSST